MSDPDQLRLERRGRLAAHLKRLRLDAGLTQQAVAEYQRVLQVDPRNITALVRWHIAMITSLGTARATTLPCEPLSLPPTAARHLSRILPTLTQPCPCLSNERTTS